MQNSNSNSNSEHVKKEKGEQKENKRKTYARKTKQQMKLKNNKRKLNVAKGIYDLCEINWGNWSTKRTDKKRTKTKYSYIKISPIPCLLFHVFQVLFPLLFFLFLMTKYYRIFDLSLLYGGRCRKEYCMNAFKAAN